MVIRANYGEGQVLVWKPAYFGGMLRELYRSRLVAAVLYTLRKSDLI